MKLNEDLIKKQKVTEVQKIELLNLYKVLIDKIEKSYNEISLSKINGVIIYYSPLKDYLQTFHQHALQKNHWANQP